VPLPDGGILENTPMSGSQRSLILMGHINDKEQSKKKQTRRLMTVNSDLLQCMQTAASESGTQTGEGSASIFLRPSSK